MKIHTRDRWRGQVRMLPWDDEKEPDLRVENDSEIRNEVPRRNQFELLLRHQGQEVVEPFVSSLILVQLYRCQRK